MAYDRVNFARGHDVCIMAIDGTWRRDCKLNSISENKASLTVDGAINGLNLKGLFLSSTGLAYRRCELYVPTARKWTSSCSRARRSAREGLKRWPMPDGECVLARA